MRGCLSHLKRKRQKEWPSNAKSLIGLFAHLRSARIDHAHLLLFAKLSPISSLHRPAHFQITSPFCNFQEIGKVAQGSSRQTLIRYLRRLHTQAVYVTLPVTPEYRFLERELIAITG